MKVAAIGELLVDFSCRETNGEGYPVMDGHPGGAPANFLAAVRKFGLEASFLGKVGDDSLGRLLKYTLEEAGIETKGLVLDKDVFTTMAFVTFSPSNDREFSFARKPGADTRLEKGEVDKTVIDSSDVLHFGTLSLTDEPARSATQFAVEYAKGQGKLISFDPNLRRPLWSDLEKAREAMLWGLGMADVVKISDEEVEFLFPSLTYEEASRVILETYGVKLVYVTMGEKGCHYRTGRGAGFVPALADIPVVDTTGAGDIFGGSAMYALLESGKRPEELEKEDTERIVRFATASAGLSTTRKGGIGSVPSLEEVLLTLDFKMSQKA